MGGSDPIGHTHKANEYDIMFDFSGLDTDSIGDGIYIEVPTGTYKGKIASCKATQSKSSGRAQFEFKVSITEAPYVGAVRTTWISVPQSADDKVMYVWARAFQSVGVPPTKLKAAGNIPAEQIPNFFQGKECFIDYTAGNRDMGEYDRVKFLTEVAYKVKKENAEAAAALGVAAPASPAAVGASAPVSASMAATPAVTVQSAPVQPAPIVPPAAANGAGGSNDLMALLNG